MRRLGRRPLAALLLLAALMAGTLVAVGASASNTVLQSKVVSTGDLAAHGIVLSALPAGVAAAVVSSDAGAATANKLIAAPKPPDETYRVMAGATYFSPKQSTWLYLYVGGPGFAAIGPIEGADTRTITSSYTGVLVDDQTGAVLRWFQGGSFTP